MESGHSHNKKPSSDAPAVGILDSTDPFEIIIFLLFGALISGYIIDRIVNFWQADEPFLEVLRSYVFQILPISIIISGIFIIGIVYSVRKLTKLNEELKMKFHSFKAQTVSSSLITEERVNRRWQKVLDYMESPNMSDWKMAIFEADIMLEEMVDKIGYKGDSLGEKLKNIEKSDFSNIDKAWEAHKIRNTIAHEGADFLITQKEVKRTIGLFEDVFKEFKYI